MELPIHQLGNNATLKSTCDFTSLHTRLRPLICGPGQWNSASHICCIDREGPSAQAFNPEVIKREKRSRVCENPETHQKALGRGWHSKAAQVKLTGCNSSHSLILKFCESQRLSGMVCKLSGVRVGRRKTQKCGKRVFFSASGWRG